MVEKVELLTEEVNPRTKCWKVVVPFRFKGVMEKDEVYPVGWKHRMFFGSRNSRDKKARIDQVDSVEQQVLREQQQAGELAQYQEERQALAQHQVERQAIQQKLEKLESRMKNSAGDSANST